LTTREESSGSEPVPAAWLTGVRQQGLHGSFNARVLQEAVRRFVLQEGFDDSLGLVAVPRVRIPRHQERQHGLWGGRLLVGAGTQQTPS